MSVLTDVAFFCVVISVCIGLSALSIVMVVTCGKDLYNEFYKKQ
jgi:hypothetical protein